ncbi:imelysin family protein [Salisaeta longa]|uniref:imelysin family protein n=1 Tax=Salisaeta longa TaxID=503170 RepID=UPI0004244F6A|nr:imelysin family protein [Salisaeta longa]
MTTAQRFTTLLTLLVVALVGTACDSGSAIEDTVSFDEIDAQAILQSEAEGVILSTYTDLDQKAGLLEEAVNTLATNPTAANLEAARTAWIATRTPWEQSESFLFGPVAEDDIDPSLDSWPVDVTGINDVLEGSQEITPGVVANLAATKRGFHTIEYFLWGEDGTKTAADFTDRGKQYLQAATVVLKNDTERLVNAWSPDGDNFVGAFVNAEAFQSQKAAVQALVSGMETIANEVGTGKIGTPLNENSIQKIESKYSENSFTDFINNMESMRHIYLGDYGDHAGQGLTDVVQQIDPELDAQIRSEIEAAIQSLQGIDMSFRDAVASGQTAPVEDAREAVLQIRETLQSQVRPLVSDL